MKRKQLGMSLIGLMVGLLISMIVILAMLVMYRMTIRNVFDAGGLVPNASQDGQLASGLLSAQAALQGAGFGIVNAKSGEQLLVLSGATYEPSSGKLTGTPVGIGSAGATGNAVLWETNAALATEPANRKCSALWVDHARSDKSPDKERAALYLLTAKGPCDPLSSSGTSVTWSSQVLISPDVLSEAVTLSASKADSCWPFGAVPESISGSAPSGGAVQVVLAYRNSSVGATNSQKVCLANFAS